MTTTHVVTPPAVRPWKRGLFAAFFVLEAAFFAIFPLSARLPVGPLVKVRAGLTALLLAAAMLSRSSATGQQ